MTLHEPGKPKEGMGEGRCKAALNGLRCEYTEAWHEANPGYFHRWKAGITVPLASWPAPPAPALDEGPNCKPETSRFPCGVCPACVGAGHEIDADRPAPPEGASEPPEWCREAAKAIDHDAVTAGGDYDFVSVDTGLAARLIHTAFQASPEARRIEVLTLALREIALHEEEDSAVGRIARRALSDQPVGEKHEGEGR